MKYQDYLATLTHCPFCDVKDRVIEAREYAFLTYARAPYHRHHLLIIPYTHKEFLSELSKEEKRDIDVLTFFALSMMKELGYEDRAVLVREGMNNGGKSVAHLHYHVVPEVRIGDIDHEGRPRSVLTEEQETSLIQELRELRDRLSIEE